MEIDKLTYLLKHPNLAEASDVSKLQSVINSHPYFQAPKAIQLKALKTSGSFAYNQKLKETAAYTNDREILFHFISSESFNKKSTPVSDVVIAEAEEIEEQSTPEAALNISQKEANQIVDATLFEPTKDKNIEPEVEAIEDSKKELAIEPRSPLVFSPEETYSFTEWLKLTSIQPIIREEEKPKKKKLIESPLIDNFLKNNPKIKPVKKTTPTVNLAAQNNTKSSDLMTETLAKVYIAQGNYKKAIQAYKILSLKNPEKSGLFADQIRAIKKLQDNNQ